ncbi:hypothetical protein ACIQXI_09435 [Lysinibacillus sp. NPDC097195]|uniref:hypothetical protein n=1 Tax=Lysinibacillus sp. NPDC097195 TaxID=3364141 RepID=UPI00381751E4
MGFQKGLAQWKTFLKPEGYLVCSEISWLHDNPANACKEFWNEGYPEIDTIPNKINQITALDYNYVFSFVLPTKDWIEEYYNPLELSLQKMEKKYDTIADANNVIAMIRQEIKLYHQHYQDYSYVFYGVRK